MTLLHLYPKPSVNPVHSGKPGCVFACGLPDVPALASFNLVPTLVLTPVQYHQNDKNGAGTEFGKSG